MPSTYATAFAAHPVRGSTGRPRDTMVHPDDTTARRPTMVRRPTTVRPSDTTVHQATTKTNSASVIRRSSVALLQQSLPKPLPGNDENNSVTTALWGRLLDPRAGRVARREGGMGQKETAVSGKNRIMIYGPKNDGYARSSTHSKRMDPCHENATPSRYRCAADGNRDGARQGR